MGEDILSRNDKDQTGLEEDNEQHLSIQENTPNYQWEDLIDFLPSKVKEGFK